MIWHDEMRFMTDEQSILHGNTKAFQHGNLFHQCHGVDNHSIANHTFDIRLQNSTWNQMKDKFLSFDHNGMSCIRTALIARHDIHGITQKIDDFSFSFIAPLGTNDNFDTHDVVK